MGTSVEWKVMISMNLYSHSHTGTLQHITKPIQSRRETGERERNNRRDGGEVRKWDLDRQSLSTGKPLFVRVASVGGQSVLRQVEYCSP